MACLGKYFNEGTSARDGWEYLPEGDHHVGVESCKMFQCRTGSPGVEFTLVDAQTRRIKASFVMKPGSEANLRVLASFAAACGMTEEEMQRYDTSSELGHRMLVGRSVMIRVERTQTGRDGQKYCEVTQWWRADKAAPSPITPLPAATANGRQSYDGDLGESPLDDVFAP
jgi:hypothetical protein